MDAIYEGNFEFEGREGIEREFDVLLAPDVNILYATYSNEDYDGHAYVLYELDGKFYEVDGGHCSCCGLEGQWEPHERSLEALLKLDFPPYLVHEARRFPEVKAYLASRAAANALQLDLISDLVCPTCGAPQYVPCKSAKKEGES